MKYLLLLFILAAVIMPLAVPNPVLAVESGSGVQIPNPIKCPDINCLVSQVIRYILGTIAIIATLMFVWGGFMMMTSGGSAERIKKAKETLAWAAIGIVVIILSWAIIRFVLGTLGVKGKAGPVAASCCRDAAGSCESGVSQSACTTSGGSYYTSCPGAPTCI